jgi:hypothetical protein
MSPFIIARLLLWVAGVPTLSARMPLGQATLVGLPGFEPAAI